MQWTFAESSMSVRRKGWKSCPVSHSVHPVLGKDWRFAKENIKSIPNSFPCRYLVCSFFWGSASRSTHSFSFPGSERESMEPDFQKSWSSSHLMYFVACNFLKSSGRSCAAYLLCQLRVRLFRSIARITALTCHSLPSLLSFSVLVQLQRKYNVFLVPRIRNGIYKTARTMRAKDN